MWCCPNTATGRKWGTLVAGEITMTIARATRTMRPGDHWTIPAGLPHGVHIAAGSVAIDVFAEPDRYPLRNDPAHDPS